MLREAQLQLLLCWFYLSQGCPSLSLGHFSFCFNNLGGDFHLWMYLPFRVTWKFPKMFTSMSPTPLALLWCDTQSYLEEGCGFSIVMYGCESWTIKKSEPWRINGFELWCWRRLLRVPWTARKPNPSILKEISPEYSLEVLMLKLQYFGHLKKLNHLKRPWCWERLKVGREGDNRRWDIWVVSLTGWTLFE